jgi:predicted nucleic acid-binding protein
LAACRHPVEVQKLVQFRQFLLDIPTLGIQVLSIPPSLVYAATALSQQYGLLSGDALIVAVMKQEGLTHLASNDGDFDRVPGLTRYAPM